MIPELNLYLLIHLLCIVIIKAHNYHITLESCNIMTVDSAMLVLGRVFDVSVCERRLSERGAGAQVNQVGPPPAPSARRGAPASPLSPPPHAGLATCAPCTTPLSPYSREPCATFLASPERSVSRSLAATRSFLN